MRCLTLPAAAAAVALLAAPAHGVDPVFTYQGVLTDGGQPADGLYDVVIEVFAGSSGGSAVSTSSFTGVEVTNGAFVVRPSIDASLLPGLPRWVGVSVRASGSGGAFTALEPRRPIDPVPYAHVADALMLRSPTTNNLLFQTSTNLYGALFDLFHHNGARFARFAADNSAVGAANVALEGGQAGTGLVFNGAVTSVLTSPTLSLTGAGSGLMIDTNVSGNASLVLPASGVDSTEMFNEPGVASNIRTSVLGLTDAFSIVLSRTIDCPAAGFVLVTGTAEVSIGHFNGTTSSVNVGVSDSALSYEAATDLNVLLAAGMPTGVYTLPVSSTYVFPVSAGSHTFYLLADEVGPTLAEVNDSTLACVYLPTSYGTVAREGGGDGAGEISAASLRAERDASILANQERLERELAEQRARTAELLGRLEALEAR